MNPMSSEMEQDWHGAGDGLLVLIVLFFYMASIQKLLEWSRASESVALGVWSAACLLPMGYLLSFGDFYSLGTFGLAVSGLFYWFVGKEILSTTIAQRKRVEDIRRAIEIEDASQSSKSKTMGAKYGANNTASHETAKRNATVNTGEDSAKIVASCPSCGKELKIRTNRSLNVKCEKCRNQFFVAAKGEVAPHKFQIIESVGSGSASIFEKIRPHLDDAPKAVFRCKVCGLERNISPDAEGFHCAGCKQYNQVGASSGNSA